jgi:uncharacterized protein YodC (DUF2158 family)
MASALPFIAAPRQRSDSLVATLEELINARPLSARALCRNRKRCLAMGTCVHETATGVVVRGMCRCSPCDAREQCQWHAEPDDGPLDGRLASNFGASDTVGVRHGGPTFLVGMIVAMCCQWSRGLRRGDMALRRRVKPQSQVPACKFDVTR